MAIIRFRAGPLPPRAPLLRGSIISTAWVFRQTAKIPSFGRDFHFTLHHYTAGLSAFPNEVNRRPKRFTKTPVKSAATSVPSRTSSISPHRINDSATASATQHASKAILTLPKALPVLSDTAFTRRLPPRVRLAVSGAAVCSALEARETLWFPPQPRYRAAEETVRLRTQRRGADPRH